MKSELGFQIFTAILPVLTLVLGFLLSTFKDKYSSGQEDRKVIGKAITDLLEIRYRFMRLRELLDYLATKLDQPIEFKAVMQQFFIANFNLGTDEISARYEETVTTIGSFDPLLGFEMRSKSQVIPYLQKLAAMTGNDLEARVFLFKAQEMLTPTIIKGLEQAIESLSKRHKRETVKEIKAMFAKSQEIPPEAEEYISFMKAQIEEKAKQATATASAQTAHSSNS